MRIAMLLVAGAAMVACGGDQAAGGRPGGGPPGGGPPAFPVDVAVATADTVTEYIRATGQIAAEQQIDLRPEVEGRIVEILAREGSEVQQGTPLYKIDDAQLKAQVARLEAERDLAQQELQRTRDLIERNASSTADLQRAEANARSAQAQLDLQVIRLERTVVRAPFSGVVGTRLVSLGDYVTSQTRLTTLQSVDPQRASFAVPERYAQRLALGQQISFAVAAIPGRTFTGTVDFVDPVVELSARAITVKARVPNRSRVLRPGMFIEVQLATDVRPNAVVIPEQATLPIASQDFVWVVVDGKATRRRVTLGVREPGIVEIRDGVAAGEMVVIGGAERLFEGAGVRPSGGAGPEGAGGSPQDRRPDGQTDSGRT
ncbi:MAG: efflux RND transporter periplasmic adaptor subunit [Gemmatimonadota bacterium]|nr:efflux RND transporter periplasmic adaptor subunit [Gemmatimonadota bacterium]